VVDLFIRRARKDDLPAIHSLIKATKINPTGLAWRCFLVAVSCEGNLLGCGQIKTHGDGSKELASIAVREHVRNQGVARAVITGLLAQEPSRPLFLMCRARLYALYVKYGFHPIKEEEMSPYFRRIIWVEKIINSRAQPEKRLMVMCLK
jgi:N-acetylglutamate synthase-like GNAT family acetyltransferase